MEMDSSTLVPKIVRHREFDCIAHVDSECRAWPLPIDSDEWP
jgi:hypothetical protein